MFNLELTIAKKMPSYAFILGKTPLLSIAELCACFLEKNISEVKKEFAILNLPSKIDFPQIFQDILGGTIKIIEIEDKIKEKSEIKIKVVHVLKKILAHDRKLIFAINTYGIGKYESILQKKTLIEVKKELKKESISSRFVNPNFQNIPSYITIKEQLIARGSELNILFGSNKIFLGRTITVQNIDKYSLRDYNKPFRDPKSGMLPPKLAQIMINMAQPQKDALIYDPFCGSGTILMEAMLMTHSVIGSDIQEKNVAGAENNLKWLKQNFNLPSSLTFKIVHANAVKINPELISKRAQIIVTEPYLGPPMGKNAPYTQVEKIINYLSKLYLDFFHNLARNFLSIRTVVIVFPYFKIGQIKYFLKIRREIEKIGFKSQELIPPQINKQFLLNSPEHKSLLYEREDQIVGREIYKFSRQKMTPKSMINNQ